MNTSDALRAVLAGERLERETTRAIFTRELGDALDPIPLAGLLVALASRGETVDEVTGAADALREAMVPFEHAFPDAIDTCGTGGDGSASFNLSTAAAIVAAAAGAKVVKHGNRSLSSRCGSADLLEACGLPLELDPSQARVVFEEEGIVFLYAPAWHPALRNAAVVRKALRVRTIFNLLGPLCNPGRVRRQLLGVAEAMRLEDYAQALTALGHERAYVVHGGGGADELTLEEGNRALAVGTAPPIELSARALGLRAAPLSALGGGDAACNRGLLERVLDHEDHPLTDAVLLNSAAALLVAQRAETAEGALALAREALASGRARAKLRSWVRSARSLKGLAP